MTGAPLIGSTRVLESFQTEKWNAFLKVGFGLSGVCLLTGVICLLSFIAWLRDRRRWLLLCLSSFTFGYSAIFLAFCATVFLPWAWIIGVIQVFAGMEHVSLWFLLIWLLELNNNRRIMRWARIFGAAILLADCTDGLVCNLFFQGSNHPMLFYVGDAITSIAFFTFLFPIFLLFAAREKRLGIATWLVVGSAAALELRTAVSTLANQEVRFTHWTLAAKLDNPILNFGLPLLLILSLVYAVYRYSAEQTREKAALEQEFQSARELQQILIPEALPEIAGFSSDERLPARAAGGRGLLPDHPADRGRNAGCAGRCLGQGAEGGNDGRAAGGDGEDAGGSER